MKLASKRLKGTKRLRVKGFHKETGIIFLKRWVILLILINDVLSPHQIQRVMTEVKFDFVRETAEILEILTNSMIHGNAVGINCPALGTGIYITLVERILNNNDFFDQCEITIVLKGYDITGYFFEKNIIKLHEIKSVWPLRSPFQNPFLLNNPSMFK